jgi:integrase
MSVIPNAGARKNAKPRNLCHPNCIPSFQKTPTLTKQASALAAIDAYQVSAQRAGLRESTIEPRVKNLERLPKLGIDILYPPEVTAFLANVNWNENTKRKRIEDIAAFYQFKNIKWAKPKCKGTEKLPLVPLESDIDLLIQTSQKKRKGKKSAAFTQLLKETGVRPGEAWRLTWHDVDFDRAVVNISPEKGSNPRQPKISPKLIGMLNNLNRNSQFIFQGKCRNPLHGLDYFRKTFEEQRKRIAVELDNPRINNITFKSLRHFKGTMEYHRTRDILHVMHVLGHKNIRNTLVYTHLISFEDDEWICKTAATVEEAKLLIEQGFEYVTDCDQLKLFKKRK